MSRHHHHDDAKHPHRDRKAEARAQRRRELAKLFFVAALVASAAAVTMIVVELRFLAGAHRAIADVRVVSREQWDEIVVGRTVRHVPRERVSSVVSFTAEDGTHVDLDSSTRDAQVAVLYSPANPQRAQLDDPLTKWGGQLTLSLLALAFGLLSLRLRRVGGHARSVADHAR